ncbi:hydrogenase maturation protease [Streptomyces sp. NPDC001922]|uniref:hydrogenase maturation protease n=1 Tax=Streptomyces sp. NPDC001922 TaxID=3364624 RepID=UPI0036B10E98
MVTAAPLVAIIGVGNVYRHDDGAGPAVVERLRARAADRPLPPRTRLSVCDGDPARLIGLWEGTGRTVVIDAVFTGPAGTPGRIRRLEPDGDTWPAGAPSVHSTHGLGLVEAVELARGLGRMPPCLVVYAVEGVDSSLGEGLSEPVAAAVESLAEKVEAECAHDRSAAARRPRPAS